MSTHLTFIEIVMQTGLAQRVHRNPLAIGRRSGGDAPGRRYHRLAADRRHSGNERRPVSRRREKAGRIVMSDASDVPFRTWICPICGQRGYGARREYFEMGEIRR